MPERYIYSLEKSPGSTIFFDVDFRSEDPTECTPRLEDDETISSLLASVYPDQSVAACGLLLTLSLLGSSSEGLIIGSGLYIPQVPPGGKSVRTWISGGEVGESYEVKVLIVTSGSVRMSFAPRTYSRTFEVVVEE